MSQKPVEYDASHIHVLEGHEAIRKRPGMYIGSTDRRGLHQLVFELTDRAVNEVLTGRAACVEIALLPGGGVRVADDGCGVSFESEGAGGPGLEALLTVMMPGVGSRDPRYPVLSLFIVGPVAVNALSSRLVAEVRGDGVCRVQEFARGVAVTSPADSGPAVGTGTAITFWPDPDIFGAAQCSFDALADRFRELAFLNRDLDISLTDERDEFEPQSLRFRSPGGARDMVAFLDEQAATVCADIIGFEREDPRMAGTMEVAFRWRPSGEELLRSFGNSRPTPVGGTHVAGFRDGMGAAVNAYARERRLLAATDSDIDVERIGEGLTAVVSVKLERPEFEGSTLGVLGNAAVRDCVRQAVEEHFGGWLREHPQQAAAVLDRIMHRARG